jgi:hypothetical protein
MRDVHRRVSCQIQITPQYEEVSQRDNLHSQPFSSIQKTRIVGLYHMQYLQSSLSCWSKKR